MEKLQLLEREEKEELLGGRSDACEGMLFASIHVDGFPKRHHGVEWQSARGTVTRGNTDASFDIHVLEEQSKEKRNSPGAPSRSLLLLLLYAARCWFCAAG